MSMSLRLKVIIILTVVGLVPMTVVGLFSVTKGKSALTERSIEALSECATQKKFQLTTVTKTLGRAMELMSSSEDAMASFYSFNDYFEENEVSTNERIDVSTDEYNTIWKTNIGLLKKYADKFDFDDVIILNKESGHIIFSIRKGDDLGRSVKSGNYIGSGIEKILSEVKNTKKLIYHDFEIYPDNERLPFALIGAPVNDRKGELVGVIVAKIGTDRFDSLMNRTNGTKTNTVSYLVGSDYLLRSNIKKHNLSSAKSIQDKIKISTNEVVGAFQTGRVSKIANNFWGEEVVSSSVSVEVFPNIKWVIVTELLTDIAFSASNSLILWFAGFLVVAVIVILGIGVLIGESIVRPISKVGTLLSVTAKSVKDNSSELEGSSVELSKSNFEQEEQISQMSEAIEELTGMVQQNVENAELSNNISDGVRQTSESGNTTVKELIDSMNQISESNKTIVKLSDVISAIAEKTAVIDEIVFQTKLLSFNASVEAERAGEHGRGFAVVAQEVGNLANLSGKAASEISSIVNESVKTVDQVSKETVEKVKRGSEVVDSVEKIFNEILSQAQKVSASSAEILGASKEQSIGINSIREAVNSIEIAVKKSASNGQSTALNSKNLTEEALKLQGAVNDLTHIISGK